MFFFILGEMQSFYSRQKTFIAIIKYTCQKYFFFKIETVLISSKSQHCRKISRFNDKFVILFLSVTASSCIY